jgi:nucleoside-diphosphate-sugar epimerase
MREGETPIPADSYGNAKLAVERELAVTMQLQGLPYFALRMHNVYGERQNMSDPYRNAVQSSSTRSCAVSRSACTATGSRSGPSPT